MIFLSVSMVAEADILDAGFFGTHFDVAVKMIDKEFGKQPKTVDANEIRYTDVKYAGMVWNEARFYCKQASKVAALKHVSELAGTMRRQHAITKDYEDRRTFFYKGGKSPMDFGHLFTIFVSPYKGGWSTQLRYGPFNVN